MIKILIADDQRLFRQGLRSMLEQEEDMTIVGEAADGQDAFMLAESTKPDIILMDVEMPKLDGIQAAQMIMERSATARILMLSVHNEDERVIAAIRSGAAGYILKDADHREFIRIIRSTWKGESITSPFLASLPLGKKIKSAEEHSNSDEDIDRKAKDAALTEREKEVLNLLLKGKSNKEISTITHISTDTVKTHLQNIYRKFGVKSRLEAVSLFLKEEDE